MGVSSFWQNTASHAVAITPSDTVKITDANSNVVSTKRIYVGGAGDLTVIMDKSTTGVTLKAVPVGTILDLEVSQVKATGTTATDLVALY